MKELTVEVENITPSKAKEYLATNTENRNIRRHKVARYAAMMRAGQWVTNHQGIAFKLDGTLMDGQHRLLAIIDAGVAVRLQVTRNIADLGNIKAMTTVDTGATRSTADQLHVCYGVKNANVVSAAISTIAALLAPSDATRSLAAPQMLGLLDTYGDRVQEVSTAFAAHFKPGMHAPVLGALALALKVHRNTTVDFIQAVSTGEGLKSGDPALVFRGWLINRRYAGQADGSKERRFLMGSVTLKCVLARKDGEQVAALRASQEAVDYFVRNSKVEVSSLRKLLNLEAA